MANMWDVIKMGSKVLLVNILALIFVLPLQILINLFMALWVDINPILSLNLLITFTFLVIIVFVLSAGFFAQKLKERGWWD